MGKPKNTLKYCIAFFLVFLIFAGCQNFFSGYGTIRQNREVSEIFEDGYVQPGYNYFYMGPDSEPRAIIALKKEYTLETTLWKPVKLTQDRLLDWIYMINHNGPTMVVQGAMIRDHSGREIGFWYSKYDSTAVKVSGKKVIVFPPGAGQRNLSLTPFPLEDW